MTPATRRALQELSQPSTPVPAALSPEHLATLDAVTRRLLPQNEEDRVDLAAVIDRGLSIGTGDGWRHADLPPDREAYARGLALIDGLARERHSRAFVDLAPAVQDSVLREVSEGRADRGDFAMTQWFGDLLATATEAYMAHPATLKRLGYDGMSFLPGWSSEELAFPPHRKPSTP